jgi:hypothetical protein
MPQHLEKPGFAPSVNRVLGHERRLVARAELVATVALFIGTLVAVTAISVGIARAADPASTIIDNEGALFAIALVLGLLFAAMGGLTVLTLPGHRPHKR